MREGFYGLTLRAVTHWLFPCGYSGGSTGRPMVLGRLSRRHSAVGDSIVWDCEHLCAVVLFGSPSKMRVAKCNQVF